MLHGENQGKSALQAFPPNNQSILSVLLIKLHTSKNIGVFADDLGRIQSHYWCVFTIVSLTVVALFVEEISLGSFKGIDI